MPAEQQQQQQVPQITLTDAAHMLGVETSPVLPPHALAGEFVQDKATGHFIHFTSVVLRSVQLHTQRMVEMQNVFIELAGLVDLAHERMSALAARLKNVDGQEEPQ